MIEELTMVTIGIRDWILNFGVSLDDFTTGYGQMEVLYAAPRPKVTIETPKAKAVAQAASAGVVSGDGYGGYGLI